MVITVHSFVCCSVNNIKYYIYKTRQKVLSKKPSEEQDSSSQDMSEIRREMEALQSRQSDTQWLGKKYLELPLHSCLYVFKVFGNITCIVKLICFPNIKGASIKMD